MSKIPTDMNNIFNFNRFGRYFSYELRNARNSYGMTMAVVGLLPAILLGIFALLTLISTYSAPEWTSPPPRGPWR